MVRPRSALACFRPRCCRRTGLRPARLPPVYRGPSSHRRPAGTTLSLTLLCNVLHHFTALSPFGRFFCVLCGRPPSSPSPSLLLPPGLLGLRAFPLGAPPLPPLLRPLPYDPKRELLLAAAESPSSASSPSLVSVGRFRFFDAPRLASRSHDGRYPLFAGDGRGRLCFLAPCCCAVHGHAACRG